MKNQSNYIFSLFRLIFELIINKFSFIVYRQRIRTRCLEPSPIREFCIKIQQILRMSYHDTILRVKVRIWFELTTSITKINNWNYLKYAWIFYLIFSVCLDKHRKKNKNTYGWCAIYSHTQKQLREKHAINYSRYRCFICNNCILLQ